DLDAGLPGEGLLVDPGDGLGEAAARPVDGDRDLRRGGAGQDGERTGGGDAGREPAAGDGRHARLVLPPGADERGRRYSARKTMSAGSIAKATRAPTAWAPPPGSRRWAKSRVPPRSQRAA